MSLPAAKPASLPVLLIEDEPAVMSYVQAALELAASLALPPALVLVALALAASAALSAALAQAALALAA